jgi:hypothetical protein
MTVTLVKSKAVVARKAHACRCCGATAIQRGETYIRETYAYDGQIYDWVMCTPCGGIAGDVYEWAGAPDEGVGNDQYVEWAEEKALDPTGAEHEHALAFLVRAGLEVPER